ncbi:MAG: SMI1/KNR4 family protein [Planctomycetaceae bacterium]|nr:SMI1/KNR4 family protein [Planctomycetaceae bacterium]MCB9950614.1 SMI1/KNR4 family protein [Planctomycetaceae bacterium]
MNWYKANVPSREIQLSPGVDESAIEHFETILGTELPEDVRETYLLYDGTANTGILPYGYDVSRLQQVEKDWSRWCAWAESGSFDQMKPHPVGPVKPNWWNAKWVPITSNGSGDHDFIDLDPDVGGRLGQVVEFNHETGPRCVSAVSFGDWLEQFADSLNAGRYRYDAEELNLLPIDE